MLQAICRLLIMDRNIKKFSFRKKLLLSFLPLLFLILFGEIFARFVFFQVKSDSTFAITKAFQIVSHKVKLKFAGNYNEEHQEKFNGAWETLFSENGSELLSEFQKEYEKHFAKLVLAATSAQTKLIVLYLPSTKINTSQATSESVSSAFYKALADKYKVEYLDFTNHLRSYSWEDVTLLPQNGHLSRFGNKVVANKLNEFLRSFYNYRSSLKMSNHLDVYGDLKPSQTDIWDIDVRMPYRVITNRQGFRNIYDLEEKGKQRILILGDSFTFGPYLPNHDTYPALFEQINNDIEVINAGVAGYTITDEASLFVEKAQFVAPDITILQVLDNDLYGMFYFKKNLFDRNKNI